MSHNDTDGDADDRLTREERRDVMMVVAGLGGFVTVVFLLLILSGALRERTQLDPSTPERYVMVKYEDGVRSERPATASEVSSFKVGGWIVGGLYACLTTLAAVTFFQATRRRNTFLTRAVLEAMSQRV